MKSLKNNVNFKTIPSNFDDVLNLAPLNIFDDIVLDFFDEISKNVLKSVESRSYPDLASFAFLCRKRHLNKLKNDYSSPHKVKRVGRGISLHFTPSNVPLNFAYSLLAGLLSGNVCLIRMSSRRFEQAEYLTKIVKDILDIGKFKKIQNYVHLFKYEHNNEITEYLTSLCDIRVVWGSDDTIKLLRSFALQPKAYDITFSDRYSFCIMDAMAIISEENVSKLASDFYNDTLFFDQNACTSPKLIYWIGSEVQIDQAKDKFWKTFHEYCEAKQYINQNNMVVEKLVKQHMCAVELDGYSYNTTGVCFNRTTIKKIPDNFEHFTSSGGLFLEYSSKDFSALNQHISRKLQTITYFGISSDELFNNLSTRVTLGVDRIVPVGRASDFSLIWDGYDLIRQMSKTISIL
ncbi:acyl-CoA reductase [Vibrio rhizosphaerae]|uniref:acyl-CoA reductase n=1 Tax=Vibrio rhizosphaerae TaxID=398736 RepID=UPI00056FBBF0|nr:acyl-CoA reductase [Vibrio rhizosphaerae]